MPNPGAPSLQDIFSGNAPASPQAAPASPSGKPSLSQIFTPGVFQPANGNTPQTPISPFNPNSPNSQYLDPNKSIAGTTTQSKFMGSLAKGFVDTAKGVVQKTGQGYMDMTKGFKQDFNQINQGSEQAASAAGGNIFSFQNSGKQMGGMGKMAGGILGLGSDAIKGVFSPLAAIFKQGEAPLAQGLENVPGFSQVANGKTGDFVSSTINTLNQKAQDLQQKNPTQFKAVQDAVNVIASLVGEGATNETGDTTINMAKTGGENLANATSNTGNKLMDIAQKTDVRLGGEAAQNAAADNQAEAASQAPQVAGKIVQGNIADVAPAQRALTQIDSSNVKNYQDLGNALDGKIKEVSALQDKAFDTRPEAINVQDLTFNGHNFVNDAIGQMKEFYTKTNNIQGLKDITTLENKANTQGLTIKEVNQLAREHGAKLNGYNANGELASGLTKQAAENTRQGLKSTVRGYMGNEAVDGSDAQLSDLIKTRDLVNQVAEKANALGQKIQQRGLLQKIGYYAGKAIDLGTGGALKNFVNYFIPRGEGLKTLNALDLQGQLTKNLKLLQGLDASGSDADFTSKLNSLIKKGNPQKLLPAPVPGSPKVNIEVPINQPSKIITNSADQTNIPRSRVGIKPKYRQGGGSITNIGPD